MNNGQCQAGSCDDRREDRRAGAAAGGDGAAPPSGHTGVLSTSSSLEEGSVSVLLDWLAGTFKELPLKDVCELFGYGLSWDQLPCGRRGYRQALQRGAVTVLYDGAPDMGVHVEVSGQGCRQLEAEGIVPEWAGFLNYLDNLGFKASRLDVAWDDRPTDGSAGVLDFEQVKEHVDAWAFTSPVKRCEEHCRRERGKAPERTLCIGSRSSDTFCRIYDKAAQTGTDGHWVRVELEFKRERAQAALRLIYCGGGRAITGVLREFLEFKDASDTDSNRSRWPVSAWWLAFLGAAAKCKLAMAPAERTCEKVSNWIDKQVLPALALLSLAPGWGLDWIAEGIERGRERLRRPHHRMLEMAILKAARAGAPA